MMKLRSALAIVGVIAAPAAGAAGLEGTWLRGDGNARVRIAPCGDKMCATNVWVRDSSSGEAVGDRLVMTLSRTGNGTFSGTAFDPKRSLSMSMTITESEGVLSSRGCLVGRVLCREMNWRAAR